MLLKSGLVYYFFILSRPVSLEGLLLSELAALKRNIFLYFAIFLSEAIEIAELCPWGLFVL